MLSNKWWNYKASDIKLVYLYSTIHSTLLFIWTHEKNKFISFLDLLIVEEDKLEMDICRKHTATDITVHFNSSHHIENRLAAYCFVHQLHLTPHRKQETGTIIQTAKNTTVPLDMIQQLNNNIKWQSTQSTHPQNQSPISWIALKYQNESHECI